MIQYCFNNILIIPMKYLLFWIFVGMALSASYTPKLGLALAQFSDVAYSSIDSISSWTCGTCSKIKMTDVKAFTNSTWEMQGYVGYSTTYSAVIVAFRGSSNVKNWIGDFDATQIAYSKCDGCKVHRGFYNGYMTVSSFVKSQIQLILSKYRNSPIYVTGHSLGGALGIVAALDIHSTFSVVPKVYTYGQPRVGNQAFANYFAKQIPDAFRVIHYADMVVHVPPMAMNFKHHNHQVWYQPAMSSYKICVAEDKTCADSISATKMSTSDHDMKNYLKIVGMGKNLKRVIDDLMALVL